MSTVIGSLTLTYDPYRALADSPPTPSEAQIAEILLPLRPEALRPYAAYTGSLGEGLWLRLCYDDDKEESHESLWSTNEDYDFVGPDSVMLDDKTIIGGLDLAAAVEVFPGRITNNGVNVQLREKIRDMLSDIEEDTGSGEGLAIFDAYIQTGYNPRHF
ncbi:hypothetical protein PENSUB_3759 [Penicillium subrubescens]|uniref:Uncharacterized protein n=1 Tax=Penicillium subrubescens TaxID=1316194 RepID=A0A1Q5UEQ0_9EURO|nr:hypothetical protein PENSUB_3759 [Penicillium subrubescens]